MKKMISLLLAAMMMCSSFALADAPVIPSGTLNASVIKFTPDQMYPVYSAPDSKSIRGRADKAAVSTNDWIQVFGSTGDWLLVQYDIHDKHNRIGYIYRNALPGDTSVQELAFTAISAVTAKKVDVTDDPLVSKTKLVALDAGANVIVLGTMGDWSYIEGTSEGKIFRGFVMTEDLSPMWFVTAVDEASLAIIGTWSLYAGNCIGADALTLNADGTVLGTYFAGSDQEDWYGVWSLRVNDAADSTEVDKPEFILSISRAAGYNEYGLRICRQAGAADSLSYALILSGEEGAGGFVMCN